MLYHKILAETLSYIFSPEDVTVLLSDDIIFPGPRLQGEGIRIFPYNTHMLVQNANPCNFSGFWGSSDLGPGKVVHCQVKNLCPLPLVKRGTAHFIII